MHTDGHGYGREELRDVAKPSSESVSIRVHPWFPSLRSL